MRVAYYEHAQDTRPRVEDIGWSELVNVLTTFRRSSACNEAPCRNRRCPGKNGSAWSPVDIEGTRANTNVKAITAAVFDLDHLDASQLALFESLRARGLAFVAHSTHSHAPPGDCCLRLVLPLSRPVLPHEWASVRARAVSALELPADPATKDVSRIYYLPDAPQGTQPVVETHDGEPLDVDALLRGAAVPKLDASFDVAELEAVAPVPVDLHALADRLLAHCRPEARPLLRDCLRGAPLPLGRHDDSLQRLMSLSAFVLPDETPEDAVVELFRASWAATPWQEGTEHLIAEAMKKLGRARERRRERDAARAAQDALVVERLRAKVVKRAAAVDTQDDAGDTGEQWAEDLTVQGGKRWRDLEPGERPSFKANVANLYSILRHSPEWRGCIRFDDVEKELRIEGSPLGEDVSAETLDSEVAVWLSKSHWGDCGLHPAPALVREVLLLVAQKNRFDPLRDYLSSLEWDGTPRLEAFFVRYFGAEDTEYVRAVSSKWLLSAVARALNPGCKMDTVLVLEGPQGIGKSRAFSLLGERWFTDTPVNTRDKDSRLLAARAWMVELSESTIFASVENEELKAFFSSSVDLIRPPFGKTHQAYRRRAVFCGTTNASQYLRRDTTGARRFWPVACREVDLEALRRDRSQLLAEAVARYNAGEEWWLSREEQRLADEVVSSRLRSEGESFPELVRLWFLRMGPDERPDAVHIAEVAERALGMSAAQINRDVETRLGNALHELDFKNRIRVSGGSRRRVWEAPEDLLNAPQMVTDASPEPDNVRPFPRGRR